MERALDSRLIVSCCNLFKLRVILREGVSKSNHPIQNLLLFVTEPRTCDNTNLSSKPDKIAKAPEGLIERQF
jgi:hypothetical protein